MANKMDRIVFRESLAGDNVDFAGDNATLHSHNFEMDFEHEYQWRRIHHADKEALSVTRAAIEEICANDSRSTMEHDFDWMMENYASVDGALNIWVCAQGQKIVGYAPLSAHKAKLRPSIHDTVIGSWTVVKHTLIGCPLFAESARDQEKWLTLELLVQIRRSFPRNGVLFLLGSRADSALFDLARKTGLRDPFCVSSYGPLHHRRAIQLPETYDAYIASLSKKTRMNLKRYEKKIMKAAHKGITISRYTTAEDVERFLDAAIPLSQKTYQWKSLGLGLHDREGLSRQLTIAAKLGRLLCYILFHGDEPLAFQVGYRFDDTYFTHDTGYDPEWTNYWVGNQLDMSIIKDQFEQYPTVRWVDFMYGDTFNKKRFSNAARLEQNFYLFPRSGLGIAMCASMQTTNFLSETGGRLLDRFGFREKFLRWHQRA